MFNEVYYYTLVAADALVKTGTGKLHTLTFSCNDAAPTAGSIIVYDSLTEANTQIFNHTFTTTPFLPVTVFLDVAFKTGLYVGFTTTADVNVTVSYK
jgi:3-hydroxymyristoyl/3-hydroxydecanoyl-(acyl carrier protein) dehydratase